MGRKPPSDALSFYRDLFKNAPSGYLVTDGGGQLLAVNATCAAWLQRDPDRLVGTSLRQLVTPGDRALLDLVYREPPSRRELALRLATRAGYLEMEAAVSATEDWWRWWLHPRQPHPQTDAIADSLPGMLFEYRRSADGSEAFTYLSDRCVEIFEIDPAAALAEASVLWNTIHLDDLDSFYRSLLRSAELLRPWEIEFQIQTPTGRDKRLQVRAYPRQHENSDVVWSGHALEVSARRSSDPSLGERHQFAQGMVETVPGVIYVLDLRSRRLLYVSPSIERLLGYSPAIALAIGAGLTDSIHPGDRPLLRAHWERLQACRDAESYDEVEYRLRRADGEWRWFRSRDTLLEVGPDGTAEQSIGTATDITPCKRAEARERAAIATRDALVQVSSRHAAAALSLLAEFGQTGDARDRLQRSRQHLQVLLLYGSLYRREENGGEAASEIDAAAYLCDLIGAIARLDPTVEIACRVERAEGTFAADTVAICGALVGAAIAAYRQRAPTAFSVQVAQTADDLYLSVSDDSDNSDASPPSEPAPTPTSVYLRQLARSLGASDGIIPSTAERRLAFAIAFAPRRDAPPPSC